MPLKEAPLKEAPLKETPLNEAPLKEAPLKEALLKQTYGSSKRGLGCTQHDAFSQYRSCSPAELHRKRHAAQGVAVVVWQQLNRCTVKPQYKHAR